MEDRNARIIDRLEADFHELSSKEKFFWEDIEHMKNLQKLMYYIEVRCAMKEGDDYPGSEYMPSRSYARGYNQPRNMNTGRYMSRGSGSWYDEMPRRRYYDDMVGSGRRYYDGERDDMINKLHKMMEAETNPEHKSTIQMAIRELEEAR